jgi:sugar fermentation stimulation protein A
LQGTGSTVYLSRSDNAKRKLAYAPGNDSGQSSLVGINTMHPNRLVAEAIAAGSIPNYVVMKSFAGSEGQRPQPVGSLFGRQERFFFIEVKNVTVSSTAPRRFLTRSARRHEAPQELMRLKRKGHRAPPSSSSTRGLQSLSARR